MIHSAFIKSEIAKRYYKLATGEDISRDDAFNRWRMLRHPDKKILRQVIKEVAKEADQEIKAS